MPHAIIEYSEHLMAQSSTQNNVEKITPEQLLSAAYEGTLASGLFDKASIKVRAMPYAYHHSGADFTNFIHVTLKILSGRTVEQRNHLSETVLNALAGLLAQDTASISLSVEVCDIETESYNKLVKR